MNRPSYFVRFVPGFLVGVCVALTAGTSVAQNAAEDGPKTAHRYETGRRTLDGIGKYYFGREIAHYMTHLGAPWLDRPERDQEERPDLLMKALALKPGDAVADLGCGTGYFSWRMAQVVGAKGVVYGVEIQPEMLAHLAVKMKERGVTNVLGVLGTTTDPTVARQLKPGGRVAFVEYRGEDPEVPIKPLHKMTEAQVRKEMSAQPLEHVETVRTLPRQHISLFRKRAEK